MRFVQGLCLGGNGILELQGENCGVGAGMWQEEIGEQGKEGKGKEEVQVKRGGGGEGEGGRG